MTPKLQQKLRACAAVIVPERRAGVAPPVISSDPRHKITTSPVSAVQASA